jgi:spore germination cell wall hydrolase CwlJ-like protein
MKEKQMQKLLLYIVSLIIAIMLWLGCQPVNAETGTPRYTPEDISILAAVAEREAGNQGIDGMRYVISVVLNRVRDPRFPANIQDVIYQPGQFSVVKTSAFKKAVDHPRSDCIEAVSIEMASQINTEVLYFNNGGYSCGKPLFQYNDHYFSK